MTGLSKRSVPKLDHVLIATDFSAASKIALACGTAVARRHHSKLFIVHVSSAQSKAKVMDAWRALQSEVTDLLVAGRLAGVDHKLLVKSGEVKEALSQVVTEHKIDLVVLGSSGRTGLWKFFLGSAAEAIMQHVSCPVLTVGPNSLGDNSNGGPKRILVPTGFAPQSLYAVAYGSWLAERVQSSLALLHVSVGGGSPQDAERVKQERLEHLRVIASKQQHGRPEAELMVEFGSVTERILETAARWKADLIILGVHSAESASHGETTWSKAMEIVRSALCPVLTVPMPK
jgi:nucleotide-binding universal stress UspA family protein